MIADPLPRIMDVSAIELMELGLVIAVLSLAKSLGFYEKGRRQLLGGRGAGQLHVSSKNLRAAERGGREP